MSRTATLSQLLRHPNEVIDSLEDGDVTITRRDGEALRLSKADRGAQSQAALDALSRLIAASLDDEACDRLADKMVLEHPWMDFLPGEHRRRFVGDYFRTARAAAKTGAFAALASFLASWEATAEAYAHGITPPPVDPAFLDAGVEVPDPRTT